MKVLSPFLAGQSIMPPINILEGDIGGLPVISCGSSFFDGLTPLIKVLQKAFDKSAFSSSNVIKE